MVVSHGPHLYFTKSVYANRKPTLPYTRSLIPVKQYDGISANLVYERLNQNPPGTLGHGPRPLARGFRASVCYNFVLQLDAESCWRGTLSLSPPGPWGGRSTTPLGPTLPSLVTAREYRSYCDLLYVHQVPGHGWARRATSSRGRRHVKCSGRWLCSNQRRRMK